MESIPSTAAQKKNSLVATLLSLFIPGAGQLYLKQRKRGLAVFATTLAFAFLISFTLENFRLGQVEINGTITTWFWIGLALFWVWNIVDANRLAFNQHAYGWLGFLIPALIIYVMAWQITDVNLDRLVTRFEDTKIIFNALIHPDLLERDKVSQTGGISFWVPCSNPPPPLGQPGGTYRVSLDKSCGNIGDPLTIRGENFTPNVIGHIYLVESAGGTNEVQLREGGQAVEFVVGADGKVQKTFQIPKVVGEPRFAGPNGVDPNNPLEYGLEVRVIYEVGAPHPSENFGDIIGKIIDAPAPNWLVSLGLARKDQNIPTLVPGKMAETIALGLMATFVSTILAVPLSFFAAHNIMTRIPGGIVVYYAMRTLLNIVRAIDTVIWGLVVVVWIGLGPFAGMLALTIHSVAALGKLYSEEIEHIDLGPIEAVTASGANLFQVVRYAVIPQIIPPFIAYTLLRWDINMRSATIVGFVAGGGIGFFVLETIRKGGYTQYAAALWAIAIVIIIVDYVSAYWRERILVGDTKVTAEAPKPFYKSPRQLFYVVIIVAVLAYSWQLTQIDLKKLFDPGPTFGKLVLDFVSIDLTPNILEVVGKQMLVTVFQALIATTFGGALAIPFSFLAARNLTGRSRLSIWIYYVARFMLSFFRSIEALLYVAIFIFWVGIGAFAGALALAVTTFALIGKLFSEAIENIDTGPVEAITATGANRLQVIVYAILPQIVPPFVSYSIYQWDINIRISTIIGFAGGGGIGLLLSTYFGQLQYHKAGTVVALIVIVVTLMDFVSAEIRKRMV